MWCSESNPGSTVSARSGIRPPGPALVLTAAHLLHFPLLSRPHWLGRRLSEPEGTEGRGDAGGASSPAAADGHSYPLCWHPQQGVRGAEDLWLMCTLECFRTANLSSEWDDAITSLNAQERAPVKAAEPEPHTAPLAASPARSTLSLHS